MSDLKPEAVDHPKHYNSHPSGIECIDIIEHMTHNCGAAVKYVWRTGLKPRELTGANADTIEDLRKAVWYLNREIERLGKVAPHG